MDYDRLFVGDPAIVGCQFIRRTVFVLYRCDLSHEFKVKVPPRTGGSIHRLAEVAAYQLAEVAAYQVAYVVVYMEAYVVAFLVVYMMAYAMA